MALSDYGLMVSVLCLFLLGWILWLCQKWRDEK